MHGFICVNKPPGLTSFDVIRKLKKHLPKVKLGHLGTLDPMATGVLPVAIGYATRLIEYIPQETKVYIATMIMGGISDTQDVWGNVTYTGVNNFDASALENAINSYTGIIEQIPPMYSAVHHEGHRLYELARKGIEVDRKSRQVHINSLQLLEISRNQEGLPLVKIQVECSKGTYVRTLCHDIGQRLGTGAVMSGLIRTRSGIFTIEDSYGLDIILNNDLSNCLLPLDYPLDALPKVEIATEQECYSILNGNSILGNYNCPQGIIKVYYENKLISIAKYIYQDEKKVIKPLKVLK
ncbi:MAG: tRNA pseudouridine(55) synthase TruB [Syntrophomonas sp.]